jgi:ParB-like chromosome segregation protein Spo0J
MPAMKGRAAVEKKAVQLERLVVEYVLARDIKPNSYNPNRQSDHDFELLISSMMEDGFTQPIVVQRATLEIVDGEHRWTGAIVCDYLRKNNLEPTPANIRAARDERAELVAQSDLEIPIVKTDMTAEQMRIATLRHNRARGSEDYELTAQVMRDLRELGALDWAQDSLALTDLELARFLDDVEAPEALGADEYGEAWEPPQRLTGNTSAQNAGEATPDTATRLRQQQERLETARNEEERRMIREELKTFRVSLIFSGEEAEIVQQVLGDQPASSLLAICRERLSDAA